MLIELELMRPTPPAVTRDPATSQVPVTVKAGELPGKIGTSVCTDNGMLPLVARMLVGTKLAALPCALSLVSAAWIRV